DLAASGCIPAFAAQTGIGETGTAACHPQLQNWKTAGAQVSAVAAIAFNTQEARQAHIVEVDRINRSEYRFSVEILQPASLLE
ncbi:MAG: hypothetical protein AAFW74_16355, partial [Pseudomonadota bacterium]